MGTYRLSRGRNLGEHPNLPHTPPQKEAQVKIIITLKEHVTGPIALDIADDIRERAHDDEILLVEVKEDE